MNLNLGDEWPFGRDANVQNERKYHLVSTIPTGNGPL